MNPLIGQKRQKIEIKEVKKDRKAVKNTKRKGKEKLFHQSSAFLFISGLDPTRRNQKSIEDPSSREMKRDEGREILHYSSVDSSQPTKSQQSAVSSELLSVSCQGESTLKRWGFFWHWLALSLDYYFHLVLWKIIHSLFSDQLTVFSTFIFSLIISTKRQRQ